MAFCDNPKCRFKDFKSETARYAVREPIEVVIASCESLTRRELKIIEVKSNLYHDMWTERLIKRRFCDECVPVVDKAEKRLEHIRYNYQMIYLDYLNDHGDNLLLHFVQSEWFARESENKKSTF